MSTASTSRRTPRSSGGSNRSWSASRAPRTPSPSCAASRAATRRTTGWRSPMRRWSQEQSGLNQVGELKRRLDALRVQLERAQREQDLEQASRLLYADIPAAERELAEAAATESSPDAMVKEEVGPDDVAEVVAAW